MVLSKAETGPQAESLNGAVSPPIRSTLDQDYKSDNYSVSLTTLDIVVFLFLAKIMGVCCAATSFQSCPTLCDPIDGSPQGSPVPGILQARTLEWVAISFPNACMHAKLLQLCSTLCDSMDSSPPGFSVHGIL